MDVYKSSGFKIMNSGMSYEFRKLPTNSEFKSDYWM